MAMNANTPQDLEKLIHRTLRSLPERRAPRTLEHRVLAAIAAHASLPWYRRSWKHWPLAAQAAFLTLSCLIAGMVLNLGRLASPLSQAHADLIDRTAPLTKAASIVSNSLTHATDTIPALWLYGALAAIAACYLALLGLGTTAYRTLIAKH